MKLAYARLTSYVHKKTIPNFDNITLRALGELSFVVPNYHLISFFYWTPLIQLIDPSEDLLEIFEDIKYEENANKKPKGYRRDESIAEEYFERSRELVRSMIEDVIPDLPGFDFMENFYCEPSRNCRMHGNVPFMLYDRSNEGLNYGFPICPILLMDTVCDDLPGVVRYADNPAKVGAMVQWYVIRIRNLMREDKEFAKRVEEDERLRNIRVIFTNGHMWKLWEFDIEYRGRSTKWYKPRTYGEIIKDQNFPIFETIDDPSEQKVWHDFRHIQLSLGLIRFGANTPNDREFSLQDTYDYLNDLQYMDKMTPEDRQKLRSKARRIKYLPKFMQRMLLGVDPENLEDGPSKRANEKVHESEDEDEQQKK